MKKRTRSILEELNSVGMRRDTDHLVEATGSNLIESCINLLNKITSSYDEDTAAELERRFLNSIRSGDPKKFKRSMNKVIESRKRGNNER